MKMWVFSRPDGLQAGDRPIALKIVTPKIKHSFYKLNVSPKYYLGWRLLAVSVSLVLLYRLLFQTLTNGVLILLAKIFRKAKNSKQ